MPVWRVQDPDAEIEWVEQVLALFEQIHPVMVDDLADKRCVCEGRSTSCHRTNPLGGEQALTQPRTTMTIDPSVRTTILEQAQGAMALAIAYVGVARGLFDALLDGALSLDALAQRAGIDPGYCAAWCDAAFALGHLDDASGCFTLTPLGRAFARGGGDAMFPVPVAAVLGAHMAERAACFSVGGERPGEKVLAERESILPLFGPMLEHNFAPLFETEIAPRLDVFAELHRNGGTVVDLGCGNGWYLRILARRFPGLYGIGLDGFEENVRQAQCLAEAERLGDRLQFRTGNLRSFSATDPVDLIAMNRALHHVWEAGHREIFETFRDHLRSGGAAVIWEPAWPGRRAELRRPPFRAMAVQNLSEYVQGNHFLQPQEIEDAFAEVGMQATTYRFREDSEAVIVGRKV